VLAKKFWAGLVLLVAVCAVAAWLVAAKANAGFKDAASVLTFVGMVAIGIERILELGWTAIGNSRLGAYWPMKQIAEAVKTVEDETDKVLGEAVLQARQTLEAAKNAAGTGAERLKEISDKLSELTSAESELKAKLGNARRLAPGSSRLMLVSEVTTLGTKAIENATKLTDGVLKDGQQVAHSAAQATDLALEIVTALQENPAKRVMSILVGAALGMLVASFMGLNIFLAVLDSEAALMAGTLGVLVTGVVMGLGSAPTHEIIKGLQRYKESRGSAEVVPSPKTAGDDSATEDFPVRGMNVMGNRRGAGMTDGRSSRKQFVIRTTD
jgi:hypothetical protein